MKLRSKLALGALAAALAAGSMATASAESHQSGSAADVLAIHELQATFHEAKSTKNLDLMMSLWADDSVLVLGGTTYTGRDQVRNAFVTKVGAFQPQNTWVSDAPSYKTQVAVHDKHATMYFECHDIDVVTQQVKALIAANVDLVKHHGHWLINNFVASQAVLGS